jgi:hypothetical protein
MKITIEQKEIELDDRILEELENFHKHKESIYNEKGEQLMSAFNIISVIDDEDIIKAHKLFKKLGIVVIADMKKFNSGEPSYNCFLINNGSNWRLQSHYIGWGMNTDDLEKCVNYIITKKDYTNNTKKDYTKDKILSRIKELENGKNVYDLNKKLTYKDKKMKGSYTKEATIFWENVNLLITELKKYV